MCAAHGQRLQIRLVMRILTNHERRASRFLSLGLGTCDAVRFKSFGMSAGELFEIGYALADLVNAGYGSFGDAFSLRTVGASAGEVYAAGFNVDHVVAVFGPGDWMHRPQPRRGKKRPAD